MPNHYAEKLPDRDYENTAAMTPVAMMTEHGLVEHNMTNHAPAHPGVVEQFETLRRAAKMFAHTVIDNCPDTRERSLALTNAEQALMWAVASIARTQ
jgi:hypothetical protein